MFHIRNPRTPLTAHSAHSGCDTALHTRTDTKRAQVRTMIHGPSRGVWVHLGKHVIDKYF